MRGLVPLMLLALAQLRSTCGGGDVGDVPDHSTWQAPMPVPPPPGFERAPAPDIHSCRCTFNATVKSPVCFGWNQEAAYLPPLDEAICSQSWTLACSAEKYYLEAAAEAADGPLFGRFKRDRRYNYVLEHVSAESGMDYLMITFLRYKDLVEPPRLQRFIANDLVGSPVKCFYDPIGMAVSPTTIRYIKVAGDLRKLFGDMSGMRVAEIGAGYGGQSSVLFDMFAISWYDYYDVPQALRLIKRYAHHSDALSTAQREGRCCGYQDGTQDLIQASASPAGGSGGPYDLVISQYALTELTDATILGYYTAVLKTARRGQLLISCALIGERRKWLMDLVAQDHPDLSYADEYPKTGKQCASGENGIEVIWGHGPGNQAPQVK